MSPENPQNTPDTPTTRVDENATRPLPPSQAEIGSNVDSQTRPLPATDEAAQTNRANTPERGRTWLPLIALAVIVVLLISALTAVFVTSSDGSGSTAANATATPAPTATPTLITALPLVPFAVSGAYSVMYPAAWFASQENVHGIHSAIFSSRQSAGIPPEMNIIYVPTNESPANMAQRDDDVLASLGQPNPVQNKTGPTTVTVAGQSWTQETADVTPGGQAQTAHAVVLSVTHGGNVYTIAYYASPSAFANLNAVAFQPMVKSFTFAS
jgi:hypothetical protein